MIGKTLGIYISIRFVKVLLGMVLGLGFLIVTVDFIEQLRKAAGIDDISLWSLYTIALLRAPSFIEQAFPFACLFAAMITLTQLNLKMELVVARSAGISAWQFLLPIGISAAIVGMLVATVYNPLSVRAFEKSKDLAAVVLAREKPGADITTRGYWVKQLDANGGTSILNAEIAREEGQVLDNVKILRLDETGQIYERMDVLKATYQPGEWQLENVFVTNENGVNSLKSLIKMPTRLTRDELLGISARPESVSFWSLRNTAERVEKSGTNGKPYLVRHHSLMALPAFLLAMVLVAATVSLRFVRFGQVGRMILGGILTGFVLYTVSSLITALGNNGVVPPIVAAWAPGFVAILFGMSALLYQEDG
jgi:lipopolysaccharide export system permease protein